MSTAIAFVCPNCQRHYGCTCQKRTAPDGRVGCGLCIQSLTQPAAQPANPHR